jgi:hypothetical protein
MSSVDAPAQTPAGLYQQLLAQGYGDSFTARIRDAYDLASELHSTRFRPGGRPFICHAVGTASILASLGAAPEVVLSGLLHGAYDHGDFGDGTRGIDTAKRDEIRRAFGADAESRLAAFAALEWQTSDWERTRSLAEGLDDLGRDTLTLRLANELEELLEFEIQFRGDGDSRLAELDAAIDAMTALARAIDQPALATAIAEAGARCDDHRLPRSVRDTIGSNHDRPPRSLTAREPFFAALLAKTRRVLRTVARRGAGQRP